MFRSIQQASIPDVCRITPNARTDHRRNQDGAKLNQKCTKKKEIDIPRPVCDWLQIF